MSLNTGSALVSRDTAWTLLIVGGWLWLVWRVQRRWFLRTAALVVCVGAIGYMLWWKLHAAEEWKVKLVALMLLLIFMLGGMLYDEWKAGRISSRR